MSTTFLLRAMMTGWSTRWWCEEQWRDQRKPAIDADADHIAGKSTQGSSASVCSTRHHGGLNTSRRPTEARCFCTAPVRKYAVVINGSNLRRAEPCPMRPTWSRPTSAVKMFVGEASACPSSASCPDAIA
jgi:hypothetical protein